jgi:hypothetical protein
MVVQAEDDPYIVGSRMKQTEQARGGGYHV